MTAENQRLASRIKQARERLGLSQSEAAKAWQVPLPTLKKWEQAQRTPRGEALEKLLPIMEKNQNLKLPRIQRNLVAGNLSIEVSSEIPKTFQHVKLNNEESLTLGFAESGNLAQVILWFMNGLAKKPQLRGGGKIAPPLIPEAGSIQFYTVDAEAGVGLRVFREFPVGKDVCEAMAISDHKRALLELEDYMLGPVVMVKTAGGPQPMKTVTEAGFYALTISKGKSDWAQAFRRKVLTEILPQIRKTGAYAVPSAPVTPHEIYVHQTFHPPEAPAKADDLVIELLMEVLHATRGPGCRRGVLVHGRTIYDIACKTGTFTAWMGTTTDESMMFTAFMTNLSAFFGRVLVRPFESFGRKSAYAYSIFPQGFGRQRRYVIAVRDHEIPAATLSRVSTERAATIVAAALEAGGEVKVS